MDNTIRQKPVKGRTIMTKFKGDEKVTLEDLAVEYGWEAEKFLELLEKAVGSNTFSELKKTDAKRQKKVNKKSSDDSMEEDTTMKARICTNTNQIENNKVTVNTIKEENTMTEKVQDNTTTTSSLEELQERKTVLEIQIQSQEGSLESQKLLIQMAEEDKARLETEVNSLKEKLATAEEELFNQECEIEKINLKISEILDRTKLYKEQLSEVEAKIDNLTIVYLVAPSYKASKFPSGRLVSNVSKGIKDIQAELVEMPKIVLPFTPEQIEDLGYDSNSKFREDYNFVLLVKKFKEEGSKVKILTNKSALVNKILDSVIGEGEW
jgi:hypothetical protein